MILNRHIRVVPFLSRRICRVHFQYIVKVFATCISTRKIIFRDYLRLRSRKSVSTYNHYSVWDIIDSVFSLLNDKTRMSSITERSNQFEINWFVFWIIIVALIYWYSHNNFLLFSAIHLHSLQATDQRTWKEDFLFFHLFDWITHSIASERDSSSLIRPER